MMMTNALVLFVFEFCIRSSVVATHYVLKQHKGTWGKSKDICEVPDISELNSHIELISRIVPANKYVWTSTNVMVSDWSKFYGCFDIRLNTIDISNNKRLFEKYFRRDIAPISSVPLKYCAFYCTGRGKQFVHLMNLCQCIKSVEKYPYRIEFTPNCLEKCSRSRKNDVFCSSAQGIPVFTYIKNLEKQIIRPKDFLHVQEQCIVKKEGKKFASDCSSNNYFRCRDPHKEIYYGNWSVAVNWCLNKKSVIVGSKGFSTLNFWLDTFLLSNSNKDQRNRKCVAFSIIRGTDAKTTINYRYRKCSDRLPVVCKQNGYKYTESDTVGDSVDFTTKSPATNVHYTAINYPLSSAESIGYNCTGGGTTKNHATNIQYTAVNHQQSGTESIALEIALVNGVLLVLCLLVTGLILIKRRQKHASGQSTRKSLSNRLGAEEHQLVNVRNENVEIRQVNEFADVHIHLRGSYAEPLDLDDNIVEGIYDEVIDNIAA